MGEVGTECARALSYEPCVCRPVPEDGGALLARPHQVQFPSVSSTSQDLRIWFSFCVCDKSLKCGSKAAVWGQSL